MTLKVNSLLCRQYCAYYDETAEAIESRGFCYKVSLHLSYLHIKFVDEMNKSLQTSSIHSDSPTSIVKLTSRLGYIYTGRCRSYWDL